MKDMNLKDIIEGTKGVLLHEGVKIGFSNLVIDSRKIKEGDVFLAIKGENFDGHEFIGSAIESGAKLCIIHDESFLKEDIEQVSIIKVEDTKQALLDLASFYRRRLPLKVVGVTGSTGKTSTKDLIAAALSEKYKVFKTQGNFNNDIGLPLMILNMDDSYEIAVLEMGMSNLGEIETLAKVAIPDIGVITNVGISHIEYLKTRENILKAKLEIATLFDENNTLIINVDNDMLQTVNSKDYEVLKIGIENTGNLMAYDIDLEADKISFKIKENGKELNINIEVPVPGIHNVLNSLLAIAVSRKLGVEYDEICKGIKNLQATSMRLDVIACNDITIINDTYNASPDSMYAALEVLKNYEGRKIAVLGTMKELGDEASKAHRLVGEYAKKSGIDIMFTLGEYNGDYKTGFGEENLFQFNAIEELIKELTSIMTKGDIILVKASRSMKFETIVKEIQMKNI